MWLFKIVFFGFGAEIRFSSWNFWRRCAKRLVYVHAFLCNVSKLMCVKTSCVNSLCKSLPCVKASVCKSFCVEKLLCANRLCVKLAVCTSFCKACYVWTLGCVKAFLCKSFCVYKLLCAKLAVCKSFPASNLLCGKLRVACCGAEIRFWSISWAREELKWVESAARSAEMRWDELRRAEINWGDVRRA